MGGQLRPSDWTEKLKNPFFKLALIEFLVDEWKKDEYGYLADEKVLYMNKGNDCYRFCNENGKWVRTLMPYMENHCEEADGRMMFHLSKVACPNQVSIRTADSDVVLLALYFIRSIDKDILVWCDLGSGNSRRYLSINQLHGVLGPTLCDALLGFHAWTGCDYTAAFSNQGKIKPFQKLLNDVLAQIAFSQLGNDLEVGPGTRSTLERFCCRMYGRENIYPTDDVRLHMFGIQYGQGKDVSTTKGMMNIAKGIDTGKYPPCSKVLSKKTDRANVVSGKWKCIINKHLAINPDGNGWKLNGQKYEFDGLTG